MYQSLISTSKGRKSADLLVLPVWEGPSLAHPLKEVDSLVKLPFKEKDFSGKEKELQLLYREKGKESRVLLVGLGEEKSCTLESVRSAYAVAVRSCHGKPIQSINFLLPEGKPIEFSLAALEGVLMGAYRFDQFKAKAEGKGLEQFTFCGKVSEKQLEKVVVLMESLYLARDLVNGNADDVNVDAFKKLALQIAKQYPSVKATILDKKALEKEKMGLILAVGRAAASDPAVIILEYTGDPRSHLKIAVVGKGVTYDTGGLNLKVGVGMETMKCDMAGAAAVMGIIQAAAKLKLKVNLVGAVGIAENAMGPLSYKPGDVFRARTGKTVEITNTDAEGRLVLADTISYVEDQYQPTTLIDFATLTGGVVIALGEEASGLFSNDDQLARSLERAGERTFERVWRLPLYPEYKDYLKSPIADLKNSGPRKASSPSGATFIHQFVKSVSWAHLDIAGTAYLSELKSCHPTAATGVGVRLFIEWLEQHK